MESNARGIAAVDVSPYETPRLCLFRPSRLTNGSQLEPRVAIDCYRRHRCHALGPDQIQEGVRARAEAAGQRNAWGFNRVGEPGLEHANAHVRVRVAQLELGSPKL